VRRIRDLLVTLGVLGVLVVASNAVLWAAYGHVPRPATDFSPAYLQHELALLAHEPPQTLVLGDSVVWGYGVPAGEGVVALLRRDGCACRNLAFEGDSPPNEYALLELMLAAGVRPRAVVFNVNQKVFNPADSAYRRLHPALGVLAEPLLTGAERADLERMPEGAPVERALDRAVARGWLLYAMRSDVRERIFGSPDAARALLGVTQSWSGAAARVAAAHRPTPARFEGTYDLTPLDGQNLGVRYLDRFAALLRAHDIPAIAFFTPTNHALLHEFIDNDQYRANAATLAGVLRKHGVRVIDLDGAFAPSEFLDNDHLTPAGHRHLARVLAQALPR
jgi:lysophospholipase L1-like esterase